MYTKNAAKKIPPRKCYNRGETGHIKYYCTKPRSDFDRGTNGAGAQTPAVFREINRANAVLSMIQEQQDICDNTGMHLQILLSPMAMDPKRLSLEKEMFKQWFRTAFNISRCSLCPRLSIEFYFSRKACW
ncbi:hypothetical protein ACFFRR_008705 [Megaselia abdita]